MGGRTPQIIMASTTSVPRRSFPCIATCSVARRETHTIAADLDGTLLISPISFHYFFLVAAEAGSFPRGLLLLLASPFAFLTHLLLSDTLAVKLMIFITFAGLRLRDIDEVARTVLPKFYAADVREDVWQVFSRCGRRVVVTANLKALVEPFAKGVLRADVVIGTELAEWWRTGRATGLVKRPGLVLGEVKRAALVAELGEDVQDIGIGDRESDYHFMSSCKEAYLVHPDHSARPVPSEDLPNPFVFQDGRFVRRPTPLMALATFLWLPIGIILAIVRIIIKLTITDTKLRLVLFNLLGIKLVVRGHPPPECSLAEDHKGYLFVSNHRTSLDPVFISLALQRKITQLKTIRDCIDLLKSLFGAVRSVPLTHDMSADRARVSNLLSEGDLVIFPEETTCRESLLLRFNPMFAELTDKIVPVAIEAKVSLFHGSSVRGWRFMDAFFFFMNPRPTYEVTFLNPLRLEQTMAAGKTAVDVAGRVQRLVGATLGLRCTSLTREDKHTALGGSSESEMQEFRGNRIKTEKIRGLLQQALKLV